MSWIITIAVGIAIGLIAGSLFHSMRVSSIFANIIYGIAGSIIGFWFFVTTLGLGTNTSAIGTFHGLTFVWEIIGSIVFLLVVNGIIGAENAAGFEKGEYGRSVAQEYREERRRRRR